MVEEVNVTKMLDRSVGIAQDTSPLLAPLGFAFWRMKSAFEREMGVSAGTWFSLALLSKKDGISQGELSKTFEIDPSRVTRLAKRLEGEGLILRKRDPEDHRIVRMFLTEKGRGLVQDLSEHRVRFDRRIAALLVPEELTELRRILGVLAKNMKD
ncbi:MAG: MarR family transcriptional regulator, organic hydroperoxide resistance regulator [Rubrobacteraceae bacterium]|nr:MarR family transcriptional regulator, organic hydroperoxide resistance regulator [Rubrobacteraceae bacterium]